MRFSNEVQSLLVNRSIRDFTNFFIYGLVILLSVILIILVDSFLLIKVKFKKRYNWNYDLNKFKKWYYLLSFGTLIGAYINFSHVGFSFEQLFLNPREYEFTFGASTFINYLYFLAPVALCQGLFLKHQKVKLRHFNLITVLLILSSLLHGVKFTVFDTILIPSFFYYYLKNQNIGLKIPILILSALLIFYSLFASFVRGGGETFISQILSYILPNYVNLANALNEKIVQWDGLSIFIPDKIPSIFEEFYLLSEEGFVLNDLYNMQTAYLNYYRFASYMGPILFLLPIVTFRRFLINVWSKSCSNIFLLAMIDYCLLFVFFFHAFTKTKYWYLVFIMFIIHITTKKKILLEIDE